MNVETLRNYCLSKKGTTESFPFDETTLVFKVMNKMFALINLGGNLSVNLKCDPENAIDLREKYAYVVPGYHMNKQHWNTVYIDDMVPDQLIKKWVDDSYTLIVNSLPKKHKLELAAL